MMCVCVWMVCVWMCVWMVCVYMCVWIDGVCVDVDGGCMCVCVEWCVCVDGVCVCMCVRVYGWWVWGCGWWVGEGQVGRWTIDNRRMDEHDKNKVANDEKVESVLSPERLTALGKPCRPAALSGSRRLQPCSVFPRF